MDRIKRSLLLVVVGALCLVRCSDPDPTPLIDAAVDMASDGLVQTDGAVDAPLPDVAPPDAAQPDQLVPDAALPDAVLPDAALPDQALPDQALPDQALPDQAVQPPLSCQAILEADSTSKDGVYTIDPDGVGGQAPFSAYCDMTTDGGGWTLLATLATTTSHTKTPYSTWSDDWWNKPHGTPSDPTKAFSNHDTRTLKPLITDWTLLRATTPANNVKRFHFGFKQTDWDLWDKSRTISAVNVIGPFNLPNVKVSTKLDLSAAVLARSNGHWYNGVFYLGTSPNGKDADDEGLKARFHVGSNLSGSYGYAGDQRANTRWHLWLRDTKAYHRSCAEVKQAGKADGSYTLDPDGPGGNAPVTVYCATSGVSPAPVGLCQAAVGATPACRSYVGAAGFDLAGVNFAGKLTYSGQQYKVGSTGLTGNRGVLRLADGTIHSVSFGAATTHRVSSAGVHSAFGSGMSNPHGVLQLFDKNLMFGDTTQPHLFAVSGTKVGAFGPSTFASLYPTQMATGEIWGVAYLSSKIDRHDTAGKLLGSLTHASFAHNPGLVAQLADGRYLVSMHGKTNPYTDARMIFLDKNLAPIAATTAPAGMSIYTDGSFYHADIRGQHDIIQLPNEMLLIASYWTSKLVRLKKDGSYVDTLTLGTSCTGNGCATAPSGLALDKQGQLIVTMGNNVARLVTFAP